MDWVNGGERGGLPEDPESLAETGDIRARSGTGRTDGAEGVSGYLPSKFVYYFFEEVFRHPLGFLELYLRWSRNDAGFTLDVASRRKVMAFTSEERQMHERFMKAAIDMVYIKHQ